MLLLTPQVSPVPCAQDCTFKLAAKIIECRVSKSWSSEATGLHDLPISLQQHTALRCTRCARKHEQHPRRAGNEKRGSKFRTGENFKWLRSIAETQRLVSDQVSSPKALLKGPLTVHSPSCYRCIEPATAAGMRLQPDHSYIWGGLMDFRDKTPQVWSRQMLTTMIHFVILVP